MTKSNLSFSPDSAEAIFINFQKNDIEITNLTTNLIKKLEIKLWIDSRLELSSVTNLQTEKWKLNVVSTTPPKFHTLFVLTNISNKTNNLFDGLLFGLLLKLKSSSSDSSFSSEFEYNKVLSLHWAVQFFMENGKEIPETRTATKFLISSDYIYAIAPVTRVSYSSIFGNVDVFDF